MTEKRHFIDMPDSFTRLPVDERGFPVPKFVQWFDGETPTEPGEGTPDFRVVDGRWMKRAVEHELCWLCGGKLGRYKAFVLGPMCAVNRINSEPPSHYVCAAFAAKNCPFLTRPMARRNDRNLPVGNVPAAGLPLDRNPGCAAVWVTAWYTPFKPHGGNNGVLFKVGPADRVEFYAQGRRATRDEVEASVNTGLPALMNTAIEHDGPEGVKELEKLVAAFRSLLDDSFRKAA